MGLIRGARGWFVEDTMRGSGVSTQPGVQAKRSYPCMPEDNDLLS